jgi:hypothetical protein
MFDLPGSPVTTDNSSAVGGSPTSWLDVASATFQSMREVDNSNASRVAMERAADDVIDSVERAGIKDHGLVNPSRAAVRRSPLTLDNLDLSYDPFADFERRRLALAEKHPEQRDIFRTDRSLMELARERARAAEERANEVRLRYGGYAPAWTASLGGSLTGSFYDPVNLVALGAGPWGRVGLGARQLVWQAIKTGAVNVGAELATTPAVQAWRREAGLDYGAGLVAERLAEAFAAGFVLDYGIRGGSRVLRRPVFGQVPVLDRDGLVEGWQKPLSDRSAIWRDGSGQHFAPKHGPDDAVAEYRALPMQSAADVRTLPAGGGVQETQVPVFRPDGRFFVWVAKDAKTNPDWLPVRDAEGNLRAYRFRSADQPTGAPPARRPGGSTGEPPDIPAMQPGEKAAQPAPRAAAAGAERSEALEAARRSLADYETESGQEINLAKGEREALARYIAKTGSEAHDALSHFDGLSKKAKRAFVKEHREPTATVEPVTQQAQQVQQPPSPPPRDYGEAEARLEEAARRLQGTHGDLIRRAQAGDRAAQDELLRANAELKSRPSTRGAEQTADIQAKVPEEPPSEFLAEADRVKGMRDYLANAGDPDNNPMPVPPSPSVPRRLIDKDTPVGANLADRPSPRQGYDLFGKPVVPRLVLLADVVRDLATFPRLNKRNILAGARRWNPLMADKGFYVFERLDGTLVVAEGHDRWSLAVGPEGLETTGLAPKRSIDIQAEVFREADGWTEADVRAQAAHKNIAEERVTDPLQIATIMRDRPELLLDPTIAPTRHYMEQARNLARLSEEAWQIRNREGIDANYAAEVGKYVHRPEEHAEVMNLIARALKGQLGEVAPSNVEQVRAIIHDYVGRRSGSETLLPGDPGTPLYTERALVLDRALKGLRFDAGVFRMLVEEFGRIIGVGRNVLDTTANLSRKAQSQLARRIVSELASQPGLLRDWLTDAAARMMTEDPVTGHLKMPAGKRARNVAADAAAAEFTARVRTALSTPEGLASLRPREPQPLEGLGGGIDVPGGPRAQAQIDKLQADRAAHLERLARENAQGHLAEWVEAYRRGHVAGLDGPVDLTPREQIEVAELMAPPRLLDVPSAINEVRARRRAAVEEKARLEEEARAEARQKADEAAREAEAKAEAEAKKAEGEGEAKPAPKEEEPLDEPDIARLAKGRDMQISPGFRLDESFVDTGVERAGWKVYVQATHPVTGDWPNGSQPHFLVKGDRGVLFSSYIRDEGGARGIDFVENFLRKEEDALQAPKPDKYRQLMTEEAGVERLLTQWNLVNVMKRMRGGQLPPEYAAMEAALEKLGVAQQKDRKAVKATLEKAEREGTKAYADAEIESRRLGERVQTAAAGEAGSAAGGAGRRPAETGGPEAAGAGGEGAAADAERAERDAALGRGERGPDEGKRQSINPTAAEGKRLLNDAVADAQPGEFVRFDDYVPGADIAVNREIEPLMDLAREIGFTDAGGGKGKIGIVTGVRVLGPDAVTGETLVDVHFIEKDSGGAPFVWSRIPWRAVVGAAAQTDIKANHIGLFVFGGHQASEEAALGLPAASDFLGGNFRDPVGRHPLRVVGEHLVSDLGGNPWLRASRSFGDWLRGTLFHEFGHSVWRSLDDATRALLVDHANLLDVMGTRYPVFRSLTHYEPVQLAVRETDLAHKSMRRIYEDDFRAAYPGNDADTVAYRQALLNEEAVMHMLQLAYLGAIPKEMLEPIRHILEQHFNGPGRHISRALDAEPSLRAGGIRDVVVRAPTPEERAQGRLPFGEAPGERRSSLDPTLPDERTRFLDNLRMYSRAQEWAMGLPDGWKGAPHEVLRLANKGGVKNAEVEATGLKEFLAGKKSVTKADLVQHLTESRMVMEETVYGEAGRSVIYSSPGSSIVPGDPTAFEIVPNLPVGAVTARGRELVAELARLDDEYRAVMAQRAADGKRPPAQVRYQTLDDGTMRAFDIKGNRVADYSPQGDGRMLVQWADGSRDMVVRDEAGAEEMIRQHLRGGRPTDQRIREINNRRQDIRFQLDREGWTDPHYSTPQNVIGQARGFEAVDAAGRRGVGLDELQAMRAQRIRDDWRDIVAERLFTKDEAAKQALERQRDEALAKFMAIPFEERMMAPGAYDQFAQTPFLDGIGYPRPLTPEAEALQAEISRLGDEIVRASQPVSYRNLTPEKKAQVSKEIDAARRRGEPPASVRDERRVADLRARLDAATAEREVIAKEVNAEFDAMGLAPGRMGDTAFARAERRANAFHRLLEAANRDGDSAAIGTLVGHADAVDRAIDRLINSRAADLEEQLLEATGRQPGHPLVNTTDASLRYMIRRHIEHAVRKNGDFMFIAPAQVHIERGWGTVEGMRGSYDSIYPKTYLEELNEVLRDSYAFQGYRKPWLDLTDKQKADVQARMTKAGAEVKMTDMPLKQTGGKEIAHGSQDWDAMFRQEFDAEYGELAREKYWEEIWSEDGTGVAAKPRHKVDAGEGIKVFGTKDEAEAYMVDVATKRARKIVDDIKTASGGGQGGPVQFHTFELPDRVKSQVRRGGLRMFSVDPTGGEPRPRRPLDMSSEARKARAKDMGFDTSRPLYHGSAQERDALRPSGQDESFGPGVYLAPTRQGAGTYAKHAALYRTKIEGRPSSGYVHEVYVRGPLLLLDWHDINGTQERARTIYPDAVVTKQSLDAGRVRRLLLTDEFIGHLQEQGYAGVEYLESPVGEHQIVVFDPANIRSVNAAFDQAEEGSSRLAASTDPTGAGPPRRRTLSLKGGANPPDTAPAPKRPIEQVIGGFESQPHLAWMGLPDGEFRADLTHIAEKRELKETNPEFVQLLNTPDKVKAHIERVLAKPSWAYIKWDNNKGVEESLTVVRWAKTHYEIVAVSLLRSDRGVRHYIATAYNSRSDQVSERMRANVHHHGVETLRWAGAGAQSEILRLMRQAPPEHQHSAWKAHVAEIKALGNKGPADPIVPNGWGETDNPRNWVDWELRRTQSPDDASGPRMASLEGARGAARRSEGQVSLEAAQTMERAGRTEAEIQDATGWFRLNGKWAREFSDESMRLTPETAETLKATGGRAGRGRTVKLPAATAFDAPEVWRRYPELAHLSVELSRQRTIADVQAMRESGFGAGEGPLGMQTPARPAYADMDRGAIRIVADTPGEAADKFANELYRYVARIEGFPEGGAPDSAMAAVRQIRQSIDGELTAIQERMEQVGPDGPGLSQMVDQYMRVRAVGFRLDDMYPESAYGALLGTQVGEAIARRRAMTAAERQAKPFPDDLAGATPSEGSIVTGPGPQRQFGAGGQEPPSLWPERDVFAGLSPAVQQWTGLHGLPLTVRVTHILEHRGKKTAKGKYGPDGDLHTLEQVRAHIEKVTADPDFAWVSANRNGTFSMNLAKIEEGFVRIVPVSLSPPMDGRGLIPTIFNEYPKDAAWRITSAFSQEGERGLKWKQTLNGHQLVLHLLEQASDDKRTSAWFKLRGELYRRQARLQPRPAPRLLERARRLDRQASLNPVQEQEFAGLIARGASIEERLEAFQQMVGRDVSASTMWNYTRGMERRGLVTLKERLPEVLSRITPEQAAAYAALHAGGLSPNRRLAVFRKFVGDDRASRSSMYKFEKDLARRNMITVSSPEDRPPRQRMTAGLSPEQRREYAAYYPTETSAERRLERFRQMTGKPTASAASLQTFERELAAESLIAMRGRGRPAKPADPQDPAAEMMRDADRTAQIVEFGKACKN